MLIKQLVEEDFVNYKEPVMYIGTALCGGKCCIEAGIPLSVCQNDEWRKQPVINISNNDIVKRYISNDITKALCFAGLEPFEQFEDMIDIIKILRNTYLNKDTIVIYTGYYKDEIEDKIEELKQFKNIVIKFGRFVPDQDKHLDNVLGVYLASDNQYAEKIS